MLNEVFKDANYRFVEKRNLFIQVKFCPSQIVQSLVYQDQYLLADLLADSASEVEFCEENLMVAVRM